MKSKGDHEVLVEKTVSEEVVVEKGDTFNFYCTYLHIPPLQVSPVLVFTVYYPPPETEYFFVFFCSRESTKFQKCLSVVGTHLPGDVSVELKY